MMVSVINKYFFTLAAILLFIAVKAQDNSRYIVKPVIKLQASTFNLNEVKLLPGSPFYDAMKTNAAYLKTLDADRFLNRWRSNAGLQPKAPLYEGWEQTSSHMLGHYLSALALQYAASGDTIFLTKANYVVDQLDEIQVARKTGYIGGIPGDDTLWKNVAAGKILTGGFDLNGAWVPWYMLHKIWAGLLDAYLYTGNEKAKNIVVKLSDWACKEFGNMPDSLFQKMMEAEFGGMNESLAEVYAITGNQKYLGLSY
ncbi:MAG: glycoside hydrolase family 127 protein, partial [Ferruginibacter sp.]|nr:glycoside hydrolase family 127 protein [Ferruginibacter sp.]